MKSSEKLKAEQDMMRQSYELELRASKLTISEQEEKLKMYESQMLMSNGMINS